MNRSIVSLLGLVSTVALSFTTVACSGAASDDSSATSAADTTATSGSSTSDSAAHIFRAIDANDVTVVNQETTTCADGKRAASCVINNVDFSALGLTADATNSLQAQFTKGTALAKGTLTMVDHPVGGGSHAIELWATLTVTQAWTSDTDVAVGTFGQFETVTKNAANCGAINANGTGSSDCAQYSLNLLNKNTSGSVVSVDFTASTASADAVKNAESLLATDGLVVFGYEQGVARGPMSFEVTSFFLPVTAN